MVKRWTPEEEEYLTEHYKDFTALELAEYFNTTESSVRNKVTVLGIIKDIVWTIEQELYLEANYPRFSKQFISNKLNIPVPAINNKIAQLKIGKNRCIVGSSYIKTTTAAKELNINIFQVQQYIKHGYIRLHKQPKRKENLITYEEYLKLEKYTKEYMSIVELADSICYHKTKVSHDIKKEKIPTQFVIRLGRRVYVHQDAVKIYKPEEEVCIQKN